MLQFYNIYKVNFKQNIKKSPEMILKEADTFFSFINNFYPRIRNVGNNVVKIEVRVKIQNIFKGTL